MIGLIFGDTDFPTEILKKIKKKKIKYLIIDFSKSKRFKKDKKSYSVSIGQFGKIINILKLNKCKKVLFAGKVSKPKFSKLKLDLKGIYYIPRIIKASKLGDAAILIDPCDLDGWSHQMLNIYKNESLREQLSSKGQKRAQQFSWDRTVDNIVAVFQTMCIQNI